MSLNLSLDVDNWIYTLKICDLQWHVSTKNFYVLAVHNNFEEKNIPV